MEDTSLSVLNAYCKLVEAVIYLSVRPHVSVSVTHERLEKVCERNLKFAKSKMIDHYCDAFNYPVEKIREKIKEINIEELLKYKEII